MTCFRVFVDSMKGDKMTKFDEIVSGFEDLTNDEKTRLIDTLKQNTNRDTLKQLEEQLEKATSTADKIAIKTRIHALTV